MKPVLVRQHEEMTPPGLLAEWLEERGIPYEVHHSYKGEAVPDPTSYAFVASLGSPYGPNDTHEPGVVDELRSAVRGGRVERAPVRELGWREIGADDPGGSPASPRL